MLLFPLLCCGRPRPEQLPPIVQAARGSVHDLTAAAAAASVSSLHASAAAAAAAAGDPAAQQQQLLTHYAQAAALAEAWAARAAALTEQLRGLARGHKMKSSSSGNGGNAPVPDAPPAADASSSGAVKRASSPAVAYLSNPQVAAAVAAARAHVEQLPGLLLQADPEVEALTEASKAYCLCQALYDEVRPMLGCDYCSDWFHWECVGLQPPREDQDHTEVAPPDFK